eukprot:TRINITY_DN5116_c0_g1_i1.p2 TRINITY_DN5116_c0_g1~~TRINITY_DN5116_c0_g1_i1.p2  ORF type:complete len:116 (-),score=20.72 TRINITY_DN5116_c0_g1_i1:38-385(-)
MEAAPRFAYRFARAEELQTAQQSGIVPKTALDIRDGYYHLSTASQVHKVRGKYFAGVDPLYLIKFPLEVFGDTLRMDHVVHWNESFPHVYHEQLLMRDSIEVILCIPNEEPQLEY